MAVRHLPIVLLVEDSPDDVDFARRALAKSGIAHRLVVADQGDQVLELLYGNALAAPLWPALVLLDLNVPGVPGASCSLESNRIPSCARSPSRFCRPRSTPPTSRAATARTPTATTTSPTIWRSIKTRCGGLSSTGWSRSPSPKGPASRLPSQSGSRLEAAAFSRPIGFWSGLSWRGVAEYAGPPSSTTSLGEPISRTPGRIARRTARSATSMVRGAVGASSYHGPRDGRTFIRGVNHVRWTYDVF